MLCRGLPVWEQQLLRDLFQGILLGFAWWMANGVKTDGSGKGRKG